MNLESDILPIEVALSDWNPVHSCSLSVMDGNKLLFNDGTTLDWHLIRATGAVFRGLIRFRVVATPMADCDAEIYVNHWGGIHVCKISNRGAIVDRGISKDLAVRILDDGAIEIVVTFFNDHHSVSVGTCQNGVPVYRGNGRNQYIFSALDISMVKFEPIRSDQLITVIDVGARGGLQACWQCVRDRVVPILFEPEAEEARLLRSNADVDALGFPQARVVEVALADTAEMRTLYITRHPGCSSLLVPNRDILKRYRVSPAFDVVSQAEVYCERYDSLFDKGQVPRPDVIKIDTQGTEYEVLCGFGPLLYNVLGIELEATLYPVYNNQKLLGDITTFLDQFGFSLRRMQEQDSFDGDAVEFNVFYTKRGETLDDFDSVAAEKLRVIEHVWALRVSDAGLALAQSVGAL